MKITKLTAYKSRLRKLDKCPETRRELAELKRAIRTGAKLRKNVC